MRITRYEVTFTRDFVLKGYDDVIPAGTYEIRAEDARLPTVLSTGWRRVETVMRLPALGVDSGVESVITVDSDDLQNALKRDAIPSMN